MKADHVEMSWDAQNGKWLVRLEVGTEVIRRHCDHPPDADQSTLQSAAEEIVKDEGYEFDKVDISVHR